MSQNQNNVPAPTEPWWKALLSPARIRKALVVLVTVIGQALALGLITGRLSDWVTIGLGVAGLFGVFGVPNKQGIPGTYVPPVYVQPTLQPTGGTLQNTVNEEPAMKPAPRKTAPKATPPKKAPVKKASPRKQPAKKAVPRKSVK